MRPTRSTATKERAFTKSAKVSGQKKLEGRVKVARGYGPLHAENSREGEEIDPRKVLRLQGGGELVPDLDTLGVARAKGNLMLEHGPLEPGRYSKAQLAGELSADDEQGQGDMPDSERFRPTAEERESVHSTIGVNIEGQEFEIPVWQEGMSDDEAEEAARMRLEVGLSPFASDAQLEAEQNALQIGPDDASAVQNAGSPDYQLPVRPGHPLQATYARGTPDVQHYAGGTGDAYAGSGGYSASQLALINRMNSGQYDYTFGPGSPGATREDLQTYVGGRYSPAGGFARHGGWALAPKDYYSFSPSQRRALGIMDIAPANQRGQIEKYFAAGQKGFGGRGGGGGRWDRSESGSSGGYIGLGEPSRYGGGFAGYSPPSWGQEGQGGNVEIGGGGRFGQGVYTGYVDSAGRPTEDPYGAARATPASQLSGSDIRNIIGQDYSGNRQASTNPLDYLNPFGGTSKGGANTGDPTQRFVGTAVGTASNFIFPGLGFLTGPLARYVTNMIQHGATHQQVVQAVQQKQQQTAMPHASVSLPTGQGQGGGGDGNFSPDYLRSIGYREGQGTGSLWPGGGGLGGAGGGGGSFYGGNLAPHWASTAIGFGGNLGGGGPVNAGAFAGNAGLSRPFSAEQYANLSGNMKYPAPAIANAWGGPTQRTSYQDYLQGWHPTGGGRGMRQRQPGAMAHTPRLAAFAGGISDVSTQSDEEYEQELSDDFERNLRKRRFKPIKGKHFDPKDVPILEGNPAGQLMYDPTFSGKEDLFLLAQKGKSKVPSTDTVPAMLTPREAVLNRNAAELAGRENIEQLNAQGNKLAEKGVDLAGEKNMKRQKFQGGGDVDPLTMYKNRLGTPTAGGGPQPAQRPPPDPRMAPNPMARPATPQFTPPQMPPGYGGGQPYGGGYSEGGGGSPFGPPHGGGYSEQGGFYPGSPQWGQWIEAMRGAQPRSGSFYPGREQRHGRGGPQTFAGGGEVQDQADPFWKGSDLPALTAGKIDLAALKKEAQKNGMTAEQVSAIAKVMGGMGGSGGLDYGDSIPGSGGYAAGGFQGGISDIGYPPFIAPNADYHADKGGWVGPYDPNYYITRQQ